MDKNKDPAFLFYSSDFLTGTMFFTDEQVGKYIRLLCAQHQKGHLKEKDMLNVCGSYDEEVFSKFSQDSKGLYFNKRLEAETEKRSNYARSRSENRKKANNKETCVYLIKNPLNGLVKIGSSNKPERRLIELKNQLGNEELHILAVVENVEQKLESELHKQYEEYCSYNEWFKLTKNQIEEIITTNHMNNHMNNHMMKHMYKHMENENENINEDIITSNIINKDTINTFFETLWKLYPKKEGKGGISETQKKKLFNIGLEEMTKAIDRYVKSKQGTDRKYMKNGSTFFNSGYVDYLDANYEEVKNENSRHDNETETGIGVETDEAYDYDKFFA